MIDFIDLEGNRHSAVTEYTVRHGVNGEKSLSGTVYTNDAVIHDSDRGWKLEVNNEFYAITFAVPVDVGNQTHLEFDAVHEFFYDMSKDVVYGTLSGSNTAQAYLDFIFRDSGYEYRIEVDINAFSKDNFGMENRLSLFKDFVQTTGVEFVVNNRVVRIVREVGTDLSTIVKKGFNLQELRLEKNISEFVTYKRGYGAFFDEDDPDAGRLEGEYRSPLADIYGKLHADPLVDERFSVLENLEERLKQDVESSYSISVQITMEDLTKAGYQYEQPRSGDYILATNEDLGFDQRVRIVSYESHYDVSNQLIDHSITCNSLGVTQTNTGAAGIRNTANRALEEAERALERANTALVSSAGNTMLYRGEDDPRDLGYQVRYGDSWAQVIGEHYVLHIWNGAEWEPIIDTRETDVISQRVEQALEESREAKEQVERESDERRADIQAESERLSTEWNERIEGNEQIVEDVRHSTEELMNDFDRALAQANFTSLEDLTTTLNSRSLEAIELAQEADGFAAEALDIVNGIGTRVTDVESTVEGQVTSINTAIATAERVERDLTRVEETAEGARVVANRVEETAEGFERTISEVTDDVDDLSSRFVSMEANVEGIYNTVHDPDTGLLTEVSQIAEGWQVTAQRIDDMNEDMATQAQLSVLEGQISGKVSEGNVYSQLLIDARNVLFDANDRIILSAPNVTFTGSAFIPNAAIEEVTADKITGTQGAFSDLFSKLFEAEQVTADHIDVNTQFVDELIGVSGFFEKLVSEQAFIEELSASNLEIDGGRVHGTLNGNSLNFVNIDVNSLSGNLSEFVRTQWNNAAGGTVYIDGSGFHSTGVIYTELGNENATIDIYDGTIYLEQDLWASPSNRELAQIELRAGAMSMAQAQRIATLSPSQGLYMQDHLTDEVTHINYSGLTTWEGNNQTHFGVNGIRLDNGAFWERLGPSSDGMEWSVPGFMHFSAWGDRAFSVYSGSVNFGRNVHVIGNNLRVRNLDAHSEYDVLQLNRNRNDLGQLELGKYISGARWVRSTSIYDHGISSSSNVGITASGDLRRITSARRYKENIQTVDNALECGKNLLKLDMKMWQDKNALDLNGEDGQDPQRWYYGLIAEDVWKSGLEEFVETENGRIEGLYYDRLWIPLIPVIKQHDYLLNQHTDYINELSEAINLLVENKANSTEVDKLKKRVKELEKKVKRLEGAA